MTSNEPSIGQVVARALEPSAQLTLTFASLASPKSSLEEVGYKALPAESSRSIDWFASAHWLLTKPASPQLVMVATGSAVLESQESEAHMSVGGVVASVTQIGNEGIDVVYAEDGRILERADSPPPSVDDLPPLIREAWTRAGVSDGTIEDACSNMPRTGRVMTCCCCG